MSSDKGPLASSNSSVADGILPTPDPSIITWDGPSDPDNPLNFSPQKKWAISGVCIFTSLTVSFSSSEPSTAFLQFKQEFALNDTTARSVITLYLVGFVFGPTLWGPGSEHWGRRPTTIVAMLLFTLFQLGEGLGKNATTVLVCRFLSGVCGSAPFTVAIGTLIDIWAAMERGLPLCLFSASVFLGPVLGPIVGGFISTYTTWRWTYWLIMILGGISTALALLFQPETFPLVLLSKRLAQRRKENPERVKGLRAELDLHHGVGDFAKRVLYRPFQMLLLEPILLLVTIYMSLVYGLLYALFEAVPVIFIETRGFNLWQAGLTFIGVGVGTTLGALLTLVTMAHYPALVPRWKGYPPPEQRLFGSMIGGPLLVIGSFWLGWTGHYASVHWILPTIALGIIGASICLTFNSFLSYLTDTYLMYAASATAANVIIRSIVGATFPLFTTQMFHNLGINWAASLIGFIGILLTPIPFLFYKYGAAIRRRSRFSPCIDLKIAEQLAHESETA
ncbi:MFS general substrate transporter [Cylindrobasidium torrendii FP15055 ss-10]|uniref:MFS general substrate transporter n=1 Tax=Cylindrobasidium torrendii FP15055 ss-10 TaxID=1314674 RepID=A0A0D7AZ55_9AGAR|nr:MFS general substrate transporter [Cylindrobasidium torrendii FP15055 ss-10]